MPSDTSARSRREPPPSYDEDDRASRYDGASSSREKDAHIARGPRSSRPYPTEPEESRPRRPSMPRRRSILKDPQSPRTNRARSASQVRLREPSPSASSDPGTVDGRFIRHRDGKIDYMDHRDKTRSRRRPADLENKDDPHYRQFREKRDGYESEEGEALRGARKSRGPRARDSDGEDDSRHDRRPPRSRDYGGGGGGRERPRRPQSPGHEPALYGAALGAVTGAAAGHASRRERPRSFYGDSDASRPEPRGKAPHRRGYDEGDSDGYHSDRPRRRNWDNTGDRNGARDSRRGEAVRRRHPDSGTEDRAYFSDRRERRDRDDRGGRGGRGDRGDRRDRGDRDRDRDRHGEGDRYGDLRRSKSDRRSGGKDGPRRGREREGDNKNNGDWAAQGVALFKTHAMPVIKREGGRMVRKQLQNYLESQGR